MKNTNTLTPMFDMILPDSFFVDTSKLPPLLADDRLEILDKVYRFEWYFDARRFDLLSNLLTDDVVIDHLWGYAEGKIESLKLLEKIMTFLKGIRHQSTNAVLVPASDGSVAAYSYLLTVLVANAPEGSNVQLPTILGHGLATDIFKKIDGQWKVAQRTFEQMGALPAYFPDEKLRKEWEQTAVERAAQRNNRVSS